MADLRGVEWQGESLAYGTIVTAPSRGIVAMVLTGKEGAMVDGWHPLLAGQHAVMVLVQHGSLGLGRRVGSIKWMLAYEFETLRWFVR